MKRRSLLALALVAFASALLLGFDETTAAGRDDAAHALTIQATAAPNLTVKSDPFVAFTSPHRTSLQTTTRTTLTTTGERIIDVPGSFVPNPGGARLVPAPSPTTGAEQLILCDTWTVDPRARTSQTPTAVFLIGNQTVIAIPKDTVGGYQLATIGTDNVVFATGERLAIGDCSRVLTEEDALVAEPFATPPAGAARFTPALGPRVIVTPPPPNSLGGGPGATPTPFAASGQIDNVVPSAYATSSPQYGTSVYGQPLPTTPPQRFNPFLFPPRTR